MEKSGFLQDDKGNFSSTRLIVLGLVVYAMSMGVYVVANEGSVAALALVSGLVGLASGLVTRTNYTGSLRHKSNGTVTLNTKNIILSGFQTADQPAEGYWKGGTSTDWDTQANWANTTIPTLSTNVTILDGKSNYPVIGATESATCNNLFC